MTKTIAAAVIAVTLALGAGMAFAQQSDEPADPPRCQPTDPGCDGLELVDDRPDEDLLSTDLDDQDDDSEPVEAAPDDDDEPKTDEADTTEPTNHGEAVSRAAHECPAGPGHGACVSEVARSDAGKPDTATDPKPSEHDERDHDDKARGPGREKDRSGGRDDGDKNEGAEDEDGEDEGDEDED